MIFEVLDKFPTSTALLISSSLLGATGFVACLRWPKALWLMLPFSAIVAWGTADIYLDPNMGPAVWMEGGLTYAIVQAAGVALIAIPPVLGAWLTRRHAAPHATLRGAVDLEAARRRLNSRLDVAELILIVLLPEWLWPTGEDEHRRAMVAFLWLLIVVSLLLTLGAWLTGYLRLDAV